MNSSVTITTIMPVYNTEKYLRDAVESILSQTFADFELLLINDCSPDNSLDICREYEKKDSRVRVIDMPRNMGVAAVRNAGIAEAKGKYIHFMDSDDWLEPYAYAAMTESMEKNPADAVMFGITEEYFDSEGELKYTKEVVSPAQIFTDAVSLRQHIMDYEENYLYGYPVNKLYKTDYIRKIGASFPNQGQNEDILFNIDYFMDAGSLNVLDIAPYRYAHRGENSLTSKFVPEYFKWHRIRVQRLTEQFEYWGMLDDDIKSRLGVKYARFIMSALERNRDKRSGMSRSQQKKWLTALYSDELFRLLIPHASADSRLLGIFCKLFKNKHTGLSLTLAGFIHFVKTRFPIIFAKLK